MEEEKKKAYSEVVEILKLIENEEKIEKIPFEVIQLIKNNSDPDYKPTINIEIPLEDQNLKNETYSILAWIANKYWGEEVNIKNNISENNSEHSEFNNTEFSNSNEKNDNTNNLNAEAAVYNDMEPQLQKRCEELGIVPVFEIKNKWYIRIKEKILKALKIIFRTNKVEKEVHSTNT